MDSSKPSYAGKTGLTFRNRANIREQGLISLFYGVFFPSGNRLSVRHWPPKVVTTSQKHYLNIYSVLVC